MGYQRLRGEIPIAALSRHVFDGTIATRGVLRHPCYVGEIALPRLMSFSERSIGTVGNLAADLEEALDRAA